MFRREEGELKKDVPKGQRTIALSACISLGGCHQDLQDQQGACTLLLARRSDPGSGGSLWQAGAEAAAHVLGTWTVGPGTGPGTGSALQEGSPSLPSTQRPLNMERSNSASDRPPWARYPICKHDAESLTMPERLTMGD